MYPYYQGSGIQTRRFSCSYACHPDSQRLLYMTNEIDKKVEPIHVRAILTANDYSTWQTRQTRRFIHSYACHPDSQRLLYMTNEIDKKVEPIHVRAILTANDYSTSQTRQTRRFSRSYACHPDSQRLLYITNQTDKKVHPFICVPSWQPTTTLHHKPDRQEGSSIHMRAILTANDYSTSQMR